MSDRRDPAGVNARVWRLVRDAGAAGLVVGRIIDALSDLDPDVVRTSLGGQKRDGFIRQEGPPGSPYRVTESCKVPIGESAHLGPQLEEREFRCRFDKRGHLAIRAAMGNVVLLPGETRELIRYINDASSTNGVAS